MSMQITNDKNLTNLDFKTGAVSQNANRNNLTNHEAGGDKPKPLSAADQAYLSNLKSSFNLIENELINNNNKASGKSALDIDDAITKDLNSYLKLHNIKDGNLVETRRLDLRASQNAPITQVKSVTKNDLLNANYKNLKDSHKLKNGITFLNDLSSESSSSSDSSDNDEENDKALWIERYRRQKQMQNNSKN